jgi:hypothetical protein
MFFWSALKALSRHADADWYWRDFGYHCIADNKALAVPFASVVVAALSAVRGCGRCNADIRDRRWSKCRSSDVCYRVEQGDRRLVRDVADAAAWSPLVLAAWPCAKYDDTTAAAARCCRPQHRLMPLLRFLSGPSRYCAPWIFLFLLAQKTHHPCACVRAAVQFAPQQAAGLR